MFENKNEFKELLKSQQSLLKNGRNRFNEEDSNNRSRNEYQRDYARVMYSNSFRRLQGKMQLMPVEPNKFNRNRLTHSLEVSQIARSIAEIIGENAKEFDCDIYGPEDRYVVEMGAFAHDIGNPPFGHHGEIILNDLMENFGGFEGNAQSMRILMNIEKKFPKFKGLNLTLRSLLSIVKYNVSYSSGAKKFLYRDEYNLLMNKAEELKMYGITRTLDAQIVDAADEIAYCAHDLEDALAQNYFSIEEFLFELKLDSEKNDYRYADQFATFETWVDSARERAKESEVYDSSEEYSFIFRKELTSIIVHELIADLNILPVKDLKDDFKQLTGTMRENELAFNNWRLVRGIKHVTFSCINRSNDIQVYEKLGTKIITGLFQALTDKDFNKNMLLLPVEYRHNNSENQVDKKRVVVDYIGGMMDTFAIETYERIYGRNSATSLYNELTHSEKE